MTAQLHDLRLVRQLSQSVDIATDAKRKGLDVSQALQRARVARMHVQSILDRDELRRVNAARLIVERTRNAADLCAHCGQHIAARSLLAIIPARGVVMHTECASGPEGYDSRHPRARMKSTARDVTRRGRDPQEDCSHG